MGCAQLGHRANELMLPDSLQALIVNEDGGTIVGIPVGTATIRKSLSHAMIAEHSKSIDLIIKNKVTGDQAKFALLKYCANTKVHYLCRNVHPSLTQESLQAFDSRIDDALGQLTGETLDDAAKVLRGLPVKLAGARYKKTCRNAII